MTGETGRRTLVYVCNNNGSDARISKELSTLVRHSDLHFVGFDNNKHHPHGHVRFGSYFLIPGGVRNVRSVFNLFRVLVKLLAKFPEATIHVVNEQLLILLFPLLLRRHVVLDSFDSIFLRMNMPGSRALVLKRLVYGLPAYIIVTDRNRRDLLPDFAKKKAVVLPNVPRHQRYPPKRTDAKYLTLCYFGSLAERRGSRFVRGLLDANSRVRCFAAGWVADDYTQKLIEHPRVTFLGSLPQEKVNTILAEKGDYLVAVYPLTNQNNVNASPNKVFDALHTKTPVIITDGVKVAAEVVSFGSGLAVDTEAGLDYALLVRLLLDRRGTFKFSETAILENSWERFESRLLATHGIVASPTPNGC